MRSFEVIMAIEIIESAVQNLSSHPVLHKFAQISTLDSISFKHTEFTMGIGILGSKPVYEGSLSSANT